MDVLVLGLRLALAAVFIVAGAAKMVDRTGSARAVADFGVPEPIAAPIGWMLPIVEIVAGAAVLVEPFRLLGTVIVAALLLVFTVAIVANLGRGRAPECRCFGQVHSEVVGPRTLVRNGLLLAAAAVILIAQVGRFSNAPVFSAGQTSAVLVLVLGILAALGWFVLDLAQKNRALIARLEALESGESAATLTQVLGQLHSGTGEGLQVGDEAPAFSLTTLEGETVQSSAVIGEGERVMLIFTDPNCGPCNTLLPEVAVWEARAVGGPSVVVVSRGDVEVNRQKVAEHGLTHLLLQEGYVVADAFGAAATPAAVVVAGDGTIGSPVAIGPEAIRALYRVESNVPLVPLLESLPGRAEVRVPGVPAPSGQWQTIDGSRVKLNDFRGGPVLLLFWNTECSYCQRMLLDLRVWEVERRSDDPEILVITTGTLQRARAMGLRSVVVHDRDGEAMETFNVGGTPSAILIDAAGEIASRTAMGAEEIFGLLRGVREELPAN